MSDGKNKSKNQIFINGKFLSQGITGVQRFAMELARGLCKLSDEYVILSPSNISENIPTSGLRIVKVGTLKGTLWEQIDLPAYLLKNGKPLLINLANSAPIFYQRQVVTIHDLAFLYNPKWFSKAFYYWYRVLIPVLLKNAIEVITVSKFSKNELQRLLNVPYDKINVVYNAVDLRQSVNSPSENIYGRYFLFVGSMDPRKNLSGLIKAFINAQVQDTKLLVVGSSNKNFSGENLVYDSNVTFLGKVDDGELSVLYKHAVAFIYPSFYEGFGIPPIEAMSFGCPVLCSSASSLPEVCGDAALYFNPLDLAEMSNKIVEIGKDSVLRRQLITAGFEQVNKYSWSESARKVQKITGRIVDN